MTVDDLMADAAAKLDAWLEQRWDDIARQMIESGVDPNEVIVDDDLDTALGADFFQRCTAAYS